MAISYRLSKSGEEKYIHKLIKDVFNEFIAPTYSKQGIETFFDYIQPDKLHKRSNDNSFLIVAVEGKKISGVIEIREFKHISLMFVKKTSHRQGITKELLQKSLKICKNKNPDINKITVNSSPYAVPIYNKLGFSQSDIEQVKDGIRFIPMEMNLK